MVIFPKAKINIGLRITERRPDGYHNLQTIFYPISLSDALEFVVPGEPLNNDILTVTGLAVNINPEENLVMKALMKMREFCNIPFLQIHLHKMISSGAGLGGGSSDASSFLRILNRYFSFNLRDQELKDIALSLGSDCPFFIDYEPSYAEGRGEVMTPVEKLPYHLYLLLVKPEINISTAEAFAECQPDKSETNLPDLFRHDITDWKNLITNDFEKTIFKRYPQIAQLKETLYSAGAIYSSMSGSGSAVYGLFRNKPEIPDSLKRYIIYSGSL
jgi:4-diphosphocytidyl-2-C-methyl-D-erythritol kinase